MSLLIAVMVLILSPEQNAFGSIKHDPVCVISDRMDDIYIHCFTFFTKMSLNATLLHVIHFETSK